MTKEELLGMLDKEELIKAARVGREAVQAAVPGYCPEGPHLKCSARADASTFEAETWEEVLDLIKGPIFHFTDDTGGAVLVSVYLCSILGEDCEITRPKPIGIARTSSPDGDGPWTVVDGGHGLMARGPAKLETKDVTSLTFIFTDEGPSGWCLATVHPGSAEEPGDYSGLAEGDKLSKEDLEARHITRVIPE